VRAWPGRTVSHNGPGNRPATSRGGRLFGAEGAPTGTKCPDREQHDEHDADYVLDRPDTVTRLKRSFSRTI
jgi:hypothetical protein